MKKLIISISLLSSSIFLFGQCKTFTKKHCLSSLSPYISNGQINTAKIAPGETIELQLNFNKGLKYRTLVCASEFFEGVTMEIIDQSKKVIFSDTVQNTTAFWDFNAQTSNQLSIQLTTSKRDSQNELIGLGCITVLTGFKE